MTDQPTVAPQPARLAEFGISRAEVAAILRRTTYDYFDFDAIADRNSLYPPGVTPQDLADLIDDALVAAAPGGAGTYDVELGEYRLRLDITDRDGELVVTGLTPLDGPGIQHFSGDDMRRIKQAL